MASSDEKPGPMPGRGDGTTPGKALTVGQQIVDRGAQLMTTSMKPINNMSQHFNTFAIYSHDMSRQIETHHFVSRLNQDFCQCAVYDSDLPSARLIGIEYIISEKLFEGLPPDEQKLWHSHTYEVNYRWYIQGSGLYQACDKGPNLGCTIDKGPKLRCTIDNFRKFYKIKAGLWNNPRVPGIIENSELQTFAKMYGKFWCTWQVDRGDKLPLGAPALMMSPQPESTICAEMVKKRDEKYQISSDNLISSRANIATPENMNSYADHWKQYGKGFAIDLQETEMKTTAPFP